jgi:hypothetical protein
VSLESAKFVSVQPPLDSGVTFMVSIETWNPRR